MPSYECNGQRREQGTQGGTGQQDKSQSRPFRGGSGTGAEAGLSGTPTLIFLCRQILSIFNFTFNLMSTVKALLVQERKRKRVSDMQGMLEWYMWGMLECLLLLLVCSAVLILAPILLTDIAFT
jgi:hypothetical protein